MNNDDQIRDIKKVYSSPALTVLGGLAEITLGGDTSQTMTDAGTVSNT